MPPGTQDSVDKPRSVYQFGAFQLDPRDGELRKHGVKIKLQDQPRQILLVLLENAGKVVAREQIQSRLWPSNTYVDYDNAINGAVRKLRDALGDTSDNPRFVETLARRGYRFIAPVALNGEPPRSNEPVRPLKTRFRAKWWIAGGVAGLAISAVAWMWSGRRSEPVQLTTEPLTSYRGSEAHPTFSPDGTRIAFSWEGPNQDNCDIYVKLIGPGDPQRLTRDPACDYSPAWSADGLWIAFVRRLDTHQAAIMLIPSGGGQERDLVHTSSFAQDWPGWGSPNHPSLLSWSADGNWLFTSVDTKDKPPAGAVTRVSVATGEVRQVTFPVVRGRGDSRVEVSPDGRKLAFVRGVSGLTNELHVVSLTDQSLPAGQPVSILSGWLEGLAWTPDSRELVVAGNVGGREGLWRLAASGSKQAERLIGVGQTTVPSKRWMPGVDVAISRRGNRLVYSQYNSELNIWRLGLTGRGETPSRLISSTRDDHNPDYSPDGQKIVFASDRSGIEEIWAANADGSNPVPVTSFGNGWSGSPAWSPDGQSIAFDRLAGEMWDIYTVKLTGGTPVRLTVDSGAFRPRWSPDGKWIYYTSNRTGRFEACKIASTGGPEVQITRNGGYMPSVSPDGKEVYYTKLSPATSAYSDLWRIPVEGGAESKVMGDVLWLFQRTRRGIYYVQWIGLMNVCSLRYLDFATRQERSIAAAPSWGYFRVSPDERWLAYGQQDGTLKDLMLVEDFQ